MAAAAVEVLIGLQPLHLLEVLVVEVMAEQQML